MDTQPQISPARVRYIKFGTSGGWEKECIERGIARIGFGTGTDPRDRLLVAQAGRWAELAALFVAQGYKPGTATRFANEWRHFVQADSSVLWITFIGERLWWGVLEGEAQLHSDASGIFRFVRHGWQCTDVKGEPLTRDRLAGSLTKLAMFQGTSCDVDVAAYVVRRINGQKMPEVERAIAASSEMKAAVLDLLRMLEPRDFEVLVDLVFTASGWRRVGIIGKTQKTLDLDLILPSTGERAFVQAKSRTTSAELENYVARIDDGPFDRMFYVFHTGEAITDDPRVIILGPDRLPELVLDAGLTSWLIRKVS